MGGEEALELECEREPGCSSGTLLPLDLVCEQGCSSGTLLPLLPPTSTPLDSARGRGKGRVSLKAVAA